MKPPFSLQEELPSLCIHSDPCRWLHVGSDQRICVDQSSPMEEIREREKKSDRIISLYRGHVWFSAGTKQYGLQQTEFAREKEKNEKEIEREKGTVTNAENRNWS